MCSAGKRYNLLVKVGIFEILGVSFCVTRNAFTFIKQTKNNVGGMFQKVLYSPICRPFIIYGVVGSIPVS